MIFNNNSNSSNNHVQYNGNDDGQVVMWVVHDVELK